MKRITPISALMICFPAAALLAQELATTDDKLEKDHHFFVGVNLNIPHEQAFYPIEDIHNQHAKIRVGDRVVSERIAAIKEVRYERTSKISRYYADISGLQCEPGFSVENDPRVLATRTQTSMTTLFDDNTSLGDVAMRRFYDMLAMQGQPSAPANTPGPGAPPQQQEMPIEPTDMYIQARDFQDQVDFYQDGYDADRPAWDLLRVRFSIKSDQYFPKAHLAFIFQLSDEPEGEPVMSWFHFLTIEDVSETERSYDYQIKPYPAGKYVHSQEVFLFADGSEIATNLSQKHVQMTRKDATVFLSFQYLSRNEGKTRPPQRVWKYLSHEVRDNLDPELMNESITLKIDKEGQVTDIISDPRVRAALTASNMREISSQIYLPALDNGQPVPGELELKLRDLAF